MPGKTKAKKVDGAVNRILEDTNSTRFWVHTYDDDPISRLLSSRLAADLPASITIKLNYDRLAPIEIRVVTYFGRGIGKT